MQDNILKFVSAGADFTHEHEFLKRLQSGHAPLPVWQTWGTQKYKAAASFLPLLKSALEKTEEAGLTETQKVLQHNLRDENGVDEADKKLPVGSHEDWRLNFFHALGISDDDLHGDPMGSTAIYTRLLEGSMKTWDVWEHLGALLALEYLIGTEMEMVETGLKKTQGLSEIFDGASSEVQRNLLYVHDHAIHDLQGHFPDLLKAIKADLASGTHGDYKASLPFLEKLQTGAAMVQKARRAFYNGLTAATLTAQH